MSREPRLYLADILTCIENASKYVKGLSYKGFTEYQKTFDAVVRNLEIIGEAAKHIPEELKKKYPYDWRSVIGLRDILVHAYFGVSTKIVWDILKNELPGLKDLIEEIIENEEF